MPTYIYLSKFDGETRKNAAKLPDLLDQIASELETGGMKVVNQWLTLGSYEHVAVIDAPDAKAAATVLGRAASIIETHTDVLGGFTLDEAREFLSA